MPEDATRRNRWATAARPVAWIAIAAAVLGVFLTWTTDGPIRLDGTDAPNNGWLVLIVAAFALGWTRAMNAGSWVGVVGVIGVSIVIASTAVENWLDGRAVLGARASYGLVLVVAASVALAAAAVARASTLARRAFP